LNSCSGLVIRFGQEFFAFLHHAKVALIHETFGNGFLAAFVRDNYAYRRSQLYLTRPLWKPVFEPDAAMLSLIGDGVIKLNQAIPGYIDEDKMRGLTGID
jgi:hypothetical protein